MAPDHGRSLETSLPRTKANVLSQLASEPPLAVSTTPVSTPLMQILSALIRIVGDDHVLQRRLHHLGGIEGGLDGRHARCRR